MSKENISTVTGQVGRENREVLTEDYRELDDDKLEPEGTRMHISQLKSPTSTAEKSEINLENDGEIPPPPGHMALVADGGCTAANVGDITARPGEASRSNQSISESSERPYWPQEARASQSEDSICQPPKPSALPVSQQASSLYSLVKEAGVQQVLQVEVAEEVKKSTESPPNGQQKEGGTQVDQPVVQSQRYYDNRGNGEELAELRRRLKEVDSQLRHEIEQHQHEMTSLQQLHEHQLVQMKTKNEEELRRLREERLSNAELEDGNGKLPEALLADVELKNRQADAYCAQLQEAQNESSQVKAECQRLTATLSSLEEMEKEKEGVIQRLMGQVNQLQREKRQITKLESSGEFNSMGLNNEQGIDNSNNANGKDFLAEKNISSQNDLELEIRHLKDEVTSLSTTCEELEVEKTTLTEELEKIKQATATGGEAKIRRNKTDDNKELETVQHRLHTLEDEVAKLISERDTFESSLEELDVQHQQAIEQIMTSRDLVQSKYKQVLTENEDLIAKLKAGEKEKTRLIEFQKSLGSLAKTEDVEKELVQARETIKEFNGLLDFLIQHEAFAATLSKVNGATGGQERISMIKYSFQETFNQFRKTDKECHRLLAEMQRLNAYCEEQETSFQKLIKENEHLNEKYDANEKLQRVKDEQFNNENKRIRSAMDEMTLKLHAMETEMKEHSKEANAKDIALKTSEEKFQELALTLEAHNSEKSSTGAVDKECQTVSKNNVDALVQTVVDGLPTEHLPMTNDTEVVMIREQVFELQQIITTLENRLSEKERYISGMDDILNVYKENLDPDQEAFKRQQLEITQNHQLQVKNLESERDRMVAVLNDKARENSNLKLEVHRLVSVVSAERAALAKMQRDCGEMSKQRFSQKSDADELTKEAMQKLAHLVRDREVEIEALQKKNATLLALLQETDKQGSGTTNDKTTADSHSETSELKTSSAIQTLLMEREELSKRVTQLQAERVQIIISLNQKHQESVSYHAEIQRLLGMLEQESKRHELLQEQHQSIVKQFDEKQKAFLEGQDETIMVKQRLASLEKQQDNLQGKYDRLLLEDKSQPEESQDEVAGSANESERSTVRIDRNEWTSKLAEVDNLRSAIHDKDKLLCEKDHLVHEKMRHIQTTKELCQRKEEELSTMRAHLERLNQQLEDSGKETGEVKMLNLAIRVRMEDACSEIAVLKETNSALSVTLQEREFELKALREKVGTLSRLVEQQASQKNKEGADAEENNLKRLLKESEEMRHRAQGFQAERDQTLLALAHQQRENEKLREQARSMQEREERLHRELDRLRNHMLQVEDSYTQEALRAEDREKELRNRLAQAEDRIQYATSSHSAVSHNASMQVESLQEQLRTVVEQRDEILVKLSMSEDHIAQKAAALHTLQVVLEQLQQERTRDIASAQMQHNTKLAQEKQRADMLAREVSSLEGRLSETSEALEAASRLSEQIDKKEEFIRILREEVEFKETALQKAKHEIERFRNNTEVSVDRTIIKNLMVGFLTVPSGQQKDVLRVIATMLDFNKEERDKAGIDENRVGWISGWLLRKSPPPSPVYRPMSEPSTQQSLSQAFVRFLENESQPRPQVKFPMESLVAQRDHSYNKTQAQQQSGGTSFTTHSPNPFTFTLIPQSEPSTSANQLMGASHLLMKPMSTALPTFTPVSGWSSSTNSVLRDVLEKD